MEHRRTDTRSLRDLFQQQLDYLQALWRARNIAQIREQRERRRVTGAIEEIVSGTDARLRAIGDYREQLRQVTHALIDHVEQLVDRLPSATSMQRSDFLSDPLPAGLFASPREIEKLFSGQREVQALARSELEERELFALLLLGYREKQMLGSEMRGDLLVRDVRQTTIDFFGHQLRYPQWGEEAVRGELKGMLFDDVVDQVKIGLTRLRHQRKGQGEEAERARSLHNPEVYLEHLVERLGDPLTLVSHQVERVRVSPMGIKLPIDSTRPSRLLELHQVAIDRQPPRVMLLVRYPLSGLSG